MKVWEETKCLIVKNNYTNTLIIKKKEKTFIMYKYRQAAVRIILQPTSEFLLFYHHLVVFGYCYFIVPITIYIFLIIFFTIVE